MPITKSPTPPLPVRGGHEPLPVRARLRSRIQLQARAERALHRRLQARLSGPLLDRIDLHIEVPAINASDLVLPPPSDGSREIAARVAAARKIQIEPFAALGKPGQRVNAQAHGKVLDDIAPLDAASLKLLREAAEAMHLSARGYHRVLKVARTIADLDGAESIGRPHLAEALAYRALHDRFQAAA